MDSNEPPLRLSRKNAMSGMTAIAGLKARGFETCPLAPKRSRGLRPWGSAGPRGPVAVGGGGPCGAGVGLGVGAGAGVASDGPEIADCA